MAACDSLTSLVSAQFDALTTPCLLLDEEQMQRNIERLDGLVAAAGVTLRPHAKTCKSLPIVERMLARHADQRITVSTLAEAHEFAKAGYRDILYAVGIVPGKFAELMRVQAVGASELAVIVDSLAMAEALAAGWSGAPLGVYIEIDVDGERAGVAPTDVNLTAIGQCLATAPRLRVRGVMTHAGGSYHCEDTAGIEAMAARERRLACEAARRLRAAGQDCPEISVGSTPTVLAGGDFGGVTEVRVGVYVFFDTTMHSLGVCRRDEIALSVLASVIGHREAEGELVIDAGWMALSSDRGAAGFALGMVIPASRTAAAAPKLIVRGATQEHGIVASADGGPVDVALYPLGAKLRVLPIHACATAAQFDRYERLGKPGEPWARFGGWTR